MLRVKIYSVSDGKLIYSFLADKPFKAGSNWNENVNVCPETNSPVYDEIIPCSIISSTEVVEEQDGTNVQHIFVKPRYKERYYNLHHDYVSELFNNLTNAIDSISNIIKNLPPEVEQELKLSEKFWNALPKAEINSINNMPLLNRGNIVCFESVNLENATKNVWVSLIKSYDPIQKVVKEAVSVIIMGDNILTENLDTMDNFVVFGTSFVLTKNMVVRKPTDKELNYFLKMLAIP